MGILTSARKFLSVVVTLRVTKSHHAERDGYNLSCRGNSKQVADQVGPAARQPPREEAPGEFPHERLQGGDAARGEGGVGGAAAPGCARAYAGVTSDVAGLVGLAVSQTGDGLTVVTLTFSGSGVVGGSLADGRYTGTADGNPVENFFRLFGDVTGEARWTTPTGPPSWRRTGRGGAWPTTAGTSTTSTAA
jgi:hypothetical protein